MSEYGPEERALFESRATALYEEIVAQGGIKQKDPRIAARAPTGPPSTCCSTSTW